MGADRACVSSSLPFLALLPLSSPVFSSLQALSAASLPLEVMLLPLRCLVSFTLSLSLSLAFTLALAVLLFLPSSSHELCKTCS